MSDIYTHAIMDHYKNPRNRGRIAKPDIKSGDMSPSCGDGVEIYIKLKANKIDDIKFEGKGCAISMASASMLTEFVKGKSIDDVVSLTKERFLEILGIELSPSRLGCALLSFKALKLGVLNYLGREGINRDRKTRVNKLCFPYV